MYHKFRGCWITNSEFAPLLPRNVFYQQLTPIDLPPDEHQNRHILFRRHFTLDIAPRQAKIFITADDYYKLYINGTFVAQGPSPAYHFQYGYNEIDVTKFLRAGENVFAVHTLYQGLINRVWVSGDERHGLLCDLVCDGETILCSDETFLTHPHTGYTVCGKVGYDTQFMEDYDSASPEAGFMRPDFDDSVWVQAQPRQHLDYTVVPQKTKMLTFEQVKPVSKTQNGNLV